jgi:hypothetical protein
MADDQDTTFTPERNPDLGQPSNPPPKSDVSPPDPSANQPADQTVAAIPGAQPVTDTSPADPSANQLADQIVAAIKPELAPDQLDALLQNVYRSVAEAALGDQAVAELMDRLDAALVTAGYTGPTKSEIVAHMGDHRAAAAQQLEAERTAHLAEQTPGAAGPGGRYYAIDQHTKDNGRDVPPDEWGLYRHNGSNDPTRLSNFVMRITTDREVIDEFGNTRVFAGELAIRGRVVPFDVRSDEFASPDRLKAKVFAVAGPEAQIWCKPDEFRNAVSGLSRDPARAVSTTDFGWNAAGDAYLVPSGRVTAGGFVPAADDGVPRVDLAGVESADQLDLRPLDPADLERVKRQVVTDFLRLHGPEVMYMLLAAVAVAVLHRFAGGAARFALWLVGLTGSGKSLAARLTACFFGAFGPGRGQLASWTSTPNYLQHVGYFFRDAIFAVDDYKPETTYRSQVIKLLQTNADGAGRGRLKADATTNTTRAIRGQMLSTGEDVPEHSPSAVARSVIVEVPNRPKDPEVRRRCEAESPRYPGLTADFIRHLLATGRTPGFAAEVAKYADQYMQGAAGQQNDARVAGNLALMAAGFVEIARYLADVWPEWQANAAWFVDSHLPAVRDEMLGEARGQQASEIFLAELADLLEHGLVSLPQGLYHRDHEVVIGRELESSLLQVSTSRSLAAVQKSLREQGKPELAVQNRTLLDQLRQDGKLSDETGSPLAPGAKVTRQRRIGGKNAEAVICIYRQVLEGEVDTAAEAHAAVQTEERARQAKWGNVRAELERQRADRVMTKSGQVAKRN